MSRKLILSICLIITSVLFIDGLSILHYTKKDMDARIKGDERNKKNDGVVNKSNDNINESTKKTNDKSINQQENSPINLLILGLDGDGTRSDVILLANYKPGENAINILSIARDTKVIVNGKLAKINALLGMGGESLLISEIKKMTGLTIDYYLTLDFAGFREIIDKLGGVEIDVPFDMHYDDPVQDLHIHLNKGRQVLDGAKAEQFVRYRKGNSWGEGYKDGDLGRIEAQQLFIKELVKQKFNLKYFPKVVDICAILKEYARTNINLADIMYHLKNISFRDNKVNEVKAWTIPGDSVVIDSVAYFIYDREKTIEIIENNFYK